MPDEKQDERPVINMTINFPIAIPQDDEIQALKGSLEPFLQALIANGYMGLEETIAFVKFASEFSAYAPFVLDAFLQSYRRGKQDIEAQEPKESRIVTP